MRPAGPSRSKRSSPELGLGEQDVVVVLERMILWPRLDEPEPAQMGDVEMDAIWQRHAGCAPNARRVLENELLIAPTPGSAMCTSG